MKLPAAYRSQSLLLVCTSIYRCVGRTHDRQSALKAEGLYHNELRSSLRCLALPARALKRAFSVFAVPDLKRRSSRQRPQPMASKSLKALQDEQLFVHLPAPLRS